MQPADKNSSKNSCNKIVQVAILLLGLFVFSNLSIYFPTEPVAVQTTWIVNTNSRVIQGYQYPLKSVRIYKQAFTDFLSTTILNISRLHSRLTDVSLKLHLTTVLSKPHFINFCSFRLIPQSGKNEAHSILS